MVSFKDRSKRYYEMVRVGKTAENYFTMKNVVKKWYCRNEGLDMAWDCIKLSYKNTKWGNVRDRCACVVQNI